VWRRTRPASTKGGTKCFGPGRATCEDARIMVEFDHVNVLLPPQQLRLQATVSMGGRKHERGKQRGDGIPQARG
jgi:hypothetical protein